MSDWLTVPVSRIPRRAESEGHTVHLSVSPDNLSGIDCLLDEFWNGHDDDDNSAIVSFLQDEVAW